MSDDELGARVAKARLLRGLHERGTVVLPNAWDAASAALLAAAGASAIATTSGGIAWALGRQDGEGLTRTEMAEAVLRIAAAVDVPVTADVEGGYGAEPADVSATVSAIIDAGAVGANIEDSRAGGSLFSRADQCDRLRAARAAADSSGVSDFFINARTDVFLFGIGNPAGRLDETLDRAGDYAKAGADLLFVPGLLELPALSSLVASAPLPVNVMAAPGGPTITELREIGVRRITVGTGIAQAAYGVAQRAARELLNAGTYAELRPGISFAELNQLFSERA